uniref:Uncharacterized protein n=1 Tax=Ditylenchus dipsaci TaxID=166011 RepID=A0A915DI41_9BILA
MDQNAVVLCSGRCQHQRRSSSRIFANGRVSLGKKALRKCHWVFMQDPARRTRQSKHKISSERMCRIHRSRHQSTEKQRRMAGNLTGSEPLDYSIWNELKRRACVKSIRQLRR